MTALPPVVWLLLAGVAVVVVLAAVDAREQRNAERHEEFVATMARLRAATAEGKHALTSDHPTGSELAVAVSYDTGYA
jgi:hypothetical protein